MVSGTLELTICQFLKAVNVNLSTGVVCVLSLAHVVLGGWLGSKNPLNDELPYLIYLFCITHGFFKFQLLSNTQNPFSSASTTIHT
jgi:hypothetical protein